MSALLNMKTERSLQISRPPSVGKVRSSGDGLDARILRHDLFVAHGVENVSLVSPVTDANRKVLHRLVVVAPVERPLDILRPEAFDVQQGDESETITSVVLLAEGDVQHPSAPEEVLGDQLDVMPHEHLLVRDHEIHGYPPYENSLDEPRCCHSGNNPSLFPP